MGDRCRIWPHVTSLALISGIILVTPSFANAQHYRGDYYQMPERDIFPGETFTFCRIRFTSTGYRGYGNWRTDFPESDLNFSQRLEELTSIQVNKDEQGQYKHVVVDLDEQELFNYPFIYMLEVGGLTFTDSEISSLRKYLLRGGFLMVDDFWGTDEWRNWEYEISRVFPPRVYPMVDIPMDHPIFNIVFEVKEKPQVPSLHHWVRSGGGTSERWGDSANAEYKGIFHPETGRLMVVVCHNTDLGDGWERETEHRGYFDEISAKKAYPLGINIVVYAMTH